MFTGIIERIGTVGEVCDGREPRQAEAPREVDERRASADAGARRISIVTDGWPHSPTTGESISVSGCCLTLVGVERASLLFDVIPQTLTMTTLGQWQPGQRVNLERSATPTTLLGGHLVQGHVDGVGRVIKIERTQEWRVRVSAPVEVAPFLVSRGSISIDGVSLTVAAVNESSFDVCLIPETVARTTLGTLSDGDSVNLEVDAIAKLVDASVRRALGR